MQVRTLVPAGQREEGFSLIELLVAISIIGIVMSGLAFGITNSLTITRDSRERTIAANLASAEIDLANSIPNTSLQEGVLEHAERVGVTDFTVRRVSTWENGTPEAPACTALANSASGQGRRFLQVNVRVTWQGIGLRGPVRASTAITPSVATYTEGKGHVAVEVRDRAGAGLMGIPVTLTWAGPSPAPAGSAPPPKLTTSIGCAFFTDVAPGLYTVSVSLAGYVDSETGVQVGAKNVTVGDRETAKAGFTYDRRTGLDLTVSGAAGAVVPNELVVTARSGGTPGLLRTSSTGSGNSTRRTLGLTPDPGMFPYSAGWTAWAGCAHNAPGAFGGSPTALNPAPGVPVTGAVTAGTLAIDIQTRDAARGGSNPLRLYAQDQGATGAPCNALVEVGRFSADGRLVGRSAVLPFGNWRLYVQGSVVALNGDPSKTAAGGLIEVRPGVTATYREPLLYFPAVLADGPFLYYRLGETPTFGARDSSGNNRNGTYQPGVVRGLPGPLSGEVNRGLYVTGTNAYVAGGTQLTNPNVFTLEVWFATTSTTGGKLVGFGNAQTGQSSQYDRHLYLNDSGQLLFGVYPGTVRTVQSPAAYNNGAWHHAVATLSPAGMALYVDGALVASRTDTTTGENFSGYFRVGWDNLTSWTGPVSNFALTGGVDEFAYYPSALSAARVAAHYAARSGAYGSAVLADGPAIHHRFDDGIAQDASGNNRDGAYYSGTAGGAAGALLTDPDPAVTFNGSANAVISNTVQIAGPNTFSYESWFKTSSARGGRIIGFGGFVTGASNNYDRHLWMANGGQLVFGVYPGQLRTVQSPAAYNDGAWHHVVATLSSAGMALYVDGALVASRTDTTTGENFAGYFRVGADNLNNWTPTPSDTSLSGTLDEVAVYLSALTPAQVATHYAASGR